MTCHLYVYLHHMEYCYVSHVYSRYLFAHRAVSDRLWVAAADGAAAESE